MSAGCELCNSPWDICGIFITCFGCTKHFQSKCAKFKVAVGDALRGVETNGLQWYCYKCRKMSPAILHSKINNTVESVEKLSAAANNLFALIASCRADVTVLQQHVDAPSPTKTVSLSIPITRRTRSSSCDDSTINATSSTSCKFI